MCMGKRESKTNKKNLRVIGTIIKFLFIVSLVIIVFALFVDKEKSLYHILGYSFITVALIAIFLICKYPESIDLPKVKAYKFKLDFKDYKEFNNYFDNNINRIKYKKYDLNSYNDFSAYYFVRKGIIRNKVEYFIILQDDKVNMQKDEFLNRIDKIRNKIIDDIEREYRIRVKNATHVAENFILLVNEESDELKKIVNINTVGGFRYCVIICGYVFNSKTLYVSNQKDGQYFNYKYIRRKFLKVMNLKMKDRIKG